MKKTKLPSAGIKKRERPIVYSQKKYTPKDSVQISRLVAIVHSVQGCRSKKTKKILLYNSLKKAKYLVKYLRMTYDPNYDFGFTAMHVEANKKRPEYVFDKIKRLEEFPEVNKNAGPGLKAARWVAFVNCYSKGFSSVLNGMIEGDLGLGLSVKGVNKVLQRLDIDPINTRKTGNVSRLRNESRRRTKDRRRDKIGSPKNKAKPSDTRNRRPKKRIRKTADD